MQPALVIALVLLLGSLNVANAWVITPPGAVRAVRTFAAVRMTASSASDALLLEAMAALQNKEAERARELLKAATESYDAAGGPTDEQLELLAMVTARVDSALVPGVSKTVNRPPPPTPEELKLRTEAKSRGDKALMQSVSVFGDKSDGERFGKALKLLEEAREGFRRAGSEVERERDGVVGNLYSAIRAEEERAQRVAKLVRMKRLLELTKQKKKAETLGIDADEFEAVATAVAETKEASAAAAAKTEDVAVDVDDAAPPGNDLAEGILAEWRKEGVSQIDDEIDQLERQIENLEDTL